MNIDSIVNRINEEMILDNNKLSSGGFLKKDIIFRKYQIVFWMMKISPLILSVYM